MAVIHPSTLVFHDLTPDEAQILRSYGEQLMLHGNANPVPALVESWLADAEKLQAGERVSNRTLLLATVLPGRLFYSLLLYREQPKVIASTMPGG